MRSLKSKRKNVLHTNEDYAWRKSEFPPRRRSIPNGFDFDLDEVWSVRKNVAVASTGSRDGRNPAAATTRPLTDSLNLNVKKNYYSRHGGIKEKNDPLINQENAGVQNIDVPRSWNQKIGGSKF